MRRVVPFCLLALALLAPACAGQDAPGGPGYAHAPAMRALLHWERFPLNVSFSPSRLATSERKSLALAGFDEWVRATHGFVCFRVVPPGAQADLTVTFLPQIALPGSTHVGGKTTLVRAGIVLKKAVMEIAESNAEPADFQAICAHEFGHALGIDGHSDDPDDMMFPVMALPRPMVTNDEHDPPAPAHAVTRRDLDTLQAAYPGATFGPHKR